MKDKIIEQYIERWENENPEFQHKTYEFLILKTLEQSIDEYNYEYTEVDGENDIGIDNIIFKQNNGIIEDLNEIDLTTPNSDFEITFVQTKDSKKLKESELIKFYEGVKYFLISGEKRVANQRIIEFKKAWDSLMDKYGSIDPKIKLKIVFATKAPKEKFETDQIKLIIEKFDKLISDSGYLVKDSEFKFMSQDEIFDGFKKIIENNNGNQQIKYSEIIKSIGTIGNQKSEGYDSFVILTTFDELYNLISENIDFLYLENVRHFIGGSKVNEGIKSRIDNDDEKMDFWIFNNGLTLLADEINIVDPSSKLVLKNPKIIDGLQTSYSIFTMMGRMNAEKLKSIKERKVLIKVISTQDDDVKTDVIKSNNDRNKVSAINFLSMDDEQKMIETEFNKRGYSYDRIANLHKNNGIEISKIIKPLDIAISYSIFVSLCPSKARNSKTSLITNEANKKQIFDNSDKRISSYINSYNSFKLLNKKIEKFSREVRKYLFDGIEENSTLIKKHKNHLMIYIVKQLSANKKYNPEIFSKDNFNCETYFSKVNNSLINKAIAQLSEFYSRNNIQNSELEKFIKSSYCDKLLKKDIL